MTKKSLLTIFVTILLFSALSFFYISNRGSGEDNWPEQAEHIQIESSTDGSLQDAYFVQSFDTSPLIVSLHQWSASFDNYDSLVEHAVENDWNYIRPDFRGPNNNPEAGGSDLVISDIDDAIDYAIKHGNVDINRIHIIGASGGGHAALMHLMLSDKEVASYSSWVPITDLVAWYGESILRDNGYDEDILSITSSNDSILNIEEARSRSPYYQDIPNGKISNTVIQIYAGVNDGYDGSVPISHSLRFYNKLVNDLNLGEGNLIPTDIESELLYTQTVSEELDSDISFSERDIIYSNRVENISLAIFDGDHEILVDEAFEILLNLD